MAGLVLLYGLRAWSWWKRSPRSTVVATFNAPRVITRKEWRHLAQLAKGAPAQHAEGCPLKLARLSSPGASREWATRKWSLFKSFFTFDVFVSGVPKFTPFFPVLRVFEKENIYKFILLYLCIWRYNLPIYRIIFTWMYCGCISVISRIANLRSLVKNCTRDCCGLDELENIPCFQQIVQTSTDSNKKSLNSL